VFIIDCSIETECSKLAKREDSGNETASGRDEGMDSEINAPDSGGEEERGVEFTEDEKFSSVGLEVDAGEILEENLLVLEFSVGSAGAAWLVGRGGREQVDNLVSKGGIRVLG